jgi:hypothetical protein
MTTIYLLLLVAHIVGTIIGVGGATMIELHIERSLADEGRILGIDYRMVRIGLVTCILSGFGLLLLYKISGNTQALFDPRLWVKLSMVIIIAINAILLQTKAIGLYWGSAISFVSWWSVTLAGISLTNGYVLNFFYSDSFLTQFSTLMSIFAGMIIIGSGILHYYRRDTLKNI